MIFFITIQSPDSYNTYIFFVCMNCIFYVFLNNLLDPDKNECHIIDVHIEGRLFFPKDIPWKALAAWYWRYQVT